MNLIDPESAWILGGAYVGKELVVDAVKRMFGPSWDVIGAKIKNGLFGPEIEPVVSEAAQAVLNAGREPQTVPGRILNLLFEPASWEDEPDLHRRWVALLANASLPTKDNEVLPAYIEILRQLTPEQAKLVDFAYDNAVNLGMGPDDLLWRDTRRSDVQKALGLSHEKYALFITDLDRLKLVTTWRPGIWGSDDEKDDRATQYEAFQITALTVGFVRACRLPRKDS